MESYIYIYIYIGIECEFFVYKRTFNITQLIQISLLNEKVIVINLFIIGITTKELFPIILKAFLENCLLIYYSRQVQGDFNRWKRLGLNIKNPIELRGIALCYDPGISLRGGTSFCNLCKLYLNVNLWKTHQLSDYSTSNLLEEYIEYAALDSLVSRKVYEKIQSKLTSNNEIYR